MQLFSWPSSPYVRKALLVAHEVGVFDKLHLVDAGSDDQITELKCANPIGQIPTLILDNGSVIFESNEVCRYLAALPSRSFDLDEPALDEWEARQHQAVVDAILDAATAGMDERRRPVEAQHRPNLDSLMDRIDLCLTYLAKANTKREKEVSLFTLSLGSTLAYLDFRYADNPWRISHPTLADWADQFGNRRSMIATKFVVKNGW